MKVKGKYMTSLKDIAKYSGLSIPTVNQILNGHQSRFSASTCEKVLKAAEALSYRPNIAARSLRSNKSFIIGVLFFGANSKYTADLMVSIQKSLLNHQYAPIFLIHNNEDEEAINLDICLERRVDGLIVNPVIGDDGVPLLIDKYNSVIANKIPIVEVLGSFISDIPHFNLEHYKHGYELSERLVKKGCKKVAFLSHSLISTAPATTKRFSNASGMYNGYRDLLKEFGLEPHIFTHNLDSEIDTEGAFYRETLNIAEQIFNKNLNLDGIVCMNEEQALALLNYAQNNRINLDKFCIASIHSQSNKILNQFPIEKVMWPIASLGTKAADAVMSEVINPNRIKSKA